MKTINEVTAQDNVFKEHELIECISSEGTVIIDTIRLTVRAKLPGTAIVAQRYGAVAGVARVTVERVLSKWLFDASICSFWGKERCRRLSNATQAIPGMD